MTQKHENYEILNLIGYGLAKFDIQLVKQDFLINQKWKQGCKNVIIEIFLQT